MKRTTNNPDYVLYGAAIIATLFGVLAVWDAGYAGAAAMGQLLPRQFISQTVFAVLGVVFGIGISKVSPKVWPKWAGLAMLFTVLMLVAVLFVGNTINGATRWFKLGPFSFQPSELAKLVCVMYLSAGLAKLQPWKQPKIKNWAQRLDRVWWPKLKRGWPFVAVMFSVLLIEVEPDLATAMVIVAGSFLMLIVAGVSRKSLFTLAALGGAVVLMLVIKEPYRLERITNHTSRWSENKIESIGFQTTQSETALASGGVIGVGLGQGRAKHTLPEPTTDFILSTIGEEMGLLGSLFAIALLGTISWRLYAQGMTRVSRYERLFMMGMACWISVQTVANVIMANGSVAAMGVPLPFFSAGGSSLLALWMGIGMAQSIIMSPNIRIEEGSEPVNPDKAVISARTRAASVR
ncbi:MAG: FtsW/RodA/SpoVE family cell cycle protein [Fimbriimonadaceae bacterium]|nr:FtsW/RodA/SpoVE family cell cycle protein [Fimbriimonadaceae bacterium]